MPQRNLGQPVTLVDPLGDPVATGSSPTTPSYVQSSSTRTAGFTPAQVTVASAATALLPADTTSTYREITNAGTTTVFIGGSGVTATTGYPVPAGSRLPITTTAAVYGVTASGTATVGTLTGA